jgi:chorismate synthase
LKTIEAEVLSHVIAVGKAVSETTPDWEQMRALSQRKEVLLGCVDEQAEQNMKAEVDQALRTGDSVGGIFEVIGHHVPPGLGTHANWDERLDAQLAAAVMSLQAVKAVEIGRGVAASGSFGSQVHDPIGYTANQNSDLSDSNDPFTGFTRAKNNAGGVEGGMSNGENIVVRGYLKPISTLRRPLQSVDFRSREPVKAAYERSDVCVVPAAGVAGEAMVALTLAKVALEKFGGDSISEFQRNYRGYRKQISEF